MKAIIQDLYRKNSTLRGRLSISFRHFSIVSQSLLQKQVVNLVIYLAYLLKILKNACECWLSQHNFLFKNMTLSERKYIVEFLSFWTDNDIK